MEEGIYHSDRTFVKMHEISHALLRDSGIEQELQWQCDSPEEFLAQVEAYCNYGAAQLQMPNPLLDRATRRYGLTPGAVLHLAEAAGTTIPIAMRRVVYGRLEPDAHRAAFLTQRSYVKDVASANVPLEFSVGSRVPEIALEVPTAKLKRVPEAYGSRMTLGTVAW
nr:hypothetical protein [Deinococcus sp. DB0503]